MGRIIEHPGATTVIFFATGVLAATLRMDRGMSSGGECIERVLCIRPQPAAAVPRSTTNAGADHLCRDEGWIHGWQNTFWDGLTPERNEQTPHCRRFAISGV